VVVKLSQLDLISFGACSFFACDAMYFLSGLSVDDLVGLSGSVLVLNFEGKSSFFVHVSHCTCQSMILGCWYD
jgi:hypothetical protein